MTSIIDILSRVPTRNLGNILAKSTDVLLVMDDQGVILEASGDLQTPSSPKWENWIGRKWHDTVTVESRDKIRNLLDNARGRAVGAQATQVWRQVNHPLHDGSDLPVRYLTLSVNLETGSHGDGDATERKRKTSATTPDTTGQHEAARHVIAIGQDLSTVAALQQQLVGAQQSLEREYAKMMQMESRFRLLFSISNEAVLMVTSGSGEIVESNPVASRLLSRFSAPVVGEKFPIGLDKRSTALARKTMDQVTSSGIAEEIAVRFKNNTEGFVLSLTPVQQQGSNSIIVRFIQNNYGSDIDGALVHPNAMPDGVVIADMGGKILAVNQTFQRMVEVDREEDLIASALDTWLGRTDVDTDILLKSVRAHSQVKLFMSRVRTQVGRQIEVELNAQVDPSNAEQIIISIRDIERRVAANDGGKSAPAAIAKSATELTKLVGQVELKDLVRESTDLVEKLCIEAALELTENNRASAAEALGVSRQSLYTKMRRHGLGQLDA